MATHDPHADASTTPAIVAAEEGTTTVVVHHRRVHMYQLTSTELHQVVEAGNGGINLALAGILFGAAVTLTITLSTATFTDLAFAGAIGGLVAAVVGFAFFGVRAWQDYSKGRKLVGTFEDQS